MEREVIGISFGDQILVPGPYNDAKFLVKRYGRSDEATIQWFVQEFTNANPNYATSRKHAWNTVDGISQVLLTRTQRDEHAKMKQQAALQAIQRKEQELQQECPQVEFAQEPSQEQPQEQSQDPLVVQPTNTFFFDNPLDNLEPYEPYDPEKDIKQLDFYHSLDGFF